MDATRYRAAKIGFAICIAFWGLTATAGLALAGEPDLVDRPVHWYEDDRRDIPQPRERRPNLYKDMVVSSVMRPIGRTLYPPRQIRNLGVLFGGDHVLPAANVNSLDEVPNCSWFINRIGLYPMTTTEVARGPGDGTGPDCSAPWTITRAKTEGVTPGFTIRDTAGESYLIKFDPPGCRGMTTAAGVISGRIFHAAGYNVPDDSVVHFKREDLVIDTGVEVTCLDGTRKEMTDEVLDKILSTVQCSEEGQYRAIASKYLDGVPIGPFNYEATRPDDPNDNVRHQDRRELRGLRVFAAWLSHFDTKQHNSLDVYVEDGGRRYVRHCLIDFASTLGAGAGGPAARFSHEYTVSLAGFGGRLLTLGLNENDWRRLRQPEGLDEIGFFDSENFDPREYRPLQTNPAFTERTDRDGYWAAKIISAFTDEDLAAIVAEGRYENPAAADYMARILAERRDIIARCYFERITPLDFFTCEAGRLSWHDLGAERGIWPGNDSSYRSRLSLCEADRDGTDWSDWKVSTETAVDIGGLAPTTVKPFVAVQCQVDRGDGWSDTVTAWVAPASGRVIAVDR